MVLDDLGLALPDENVRTPIGAHVERLVARVQDENLMHRAASVPVRARHMLERPWRSAFGSRLTSTAAEL